MKLSELFAIYARKRLKLASPNTHRLYKHSIAAFEKTLGRAATTDDLTDDNMEMHMARVVDDGLSRSSANKDLSQIGAIWRFANRNRLCDTWPNVVAFPQPERVPLGWMPDELDRLFIAISKEEGSIFGAPACLWWRTLINVLLDTGERIGAIRLLTRDCVNGPHILVRAENRKGKTRDKLFRVTPKTAEDVRDLLALHRCVKVFPWNRCNTYLYNRYTKILERANLPSNYRYKFHALRRTCASAVANQGGDATRAMDHASARTTQKYLDPRIIREQCTADLVHRWRIDRGN